MNTQSIQSQSPAGHRYTVELRFTGSDLDPAQISRRLGLAPSTTWIGPADVSAIRHGRPVWGYNGQGEEGFQSEWLSLEEGLAFVAGRLVPFREVIVDLSRTYDGIWWCGHFQYSFDGGPTISPRVLELVASFGLPLFIDNYFEPAQP